ncbi:unnamed protein product [Schistocephalus solidus]|uniref:Uncharacterized protein n=1 Tax=Schistocephalus solidus TaxID=70667 RepID=A0A183SR83_SCHSO|nr:unnamed protein product [Schistocephalus solidus]
MSEHLPLVMLGIRAILKPDVECSSAEPLYNTTTLRIPEDFFGQSRNLAGAYPSDYVQRLHQAMTYLLSMPPRAPATRCHDRVKKTRGGRGRRWMARPEPPLGVPPPTELECHKSHVKKKTLQPNSQTPIRPLCTNIHWTDCEVGV